MWLFYCHLPQGRCGLKYVSQFLLNQFQFVTFRKEGVDWNSKSEIDKCNQKESPSARKVWIEIESGMVFFRRSQSPSARKVWIEIAYATGQTGDYRSHLPQGRCGLKCRSLLQLRLRHLSPSARKVWIEMPSLCGKCAARYVTFRKEGVDWNIERWQSRSMKWRHLPQGRCGLKLRLHQNSSCSS